MATYRIDRSRSSITFKVRHLVISSVTGKFGSFDASMTSNNPDFIDSNLDFRASVESISTGVAARDNHLRSPDVFDACKWPWITFTSTKVEKISSWAYEITGNLTIRDVTHPVKLAGTFNGVHADDSGLRWTFTLLGVLSRREWGIDFDVGMLGGNVLVDDTVKLVIEAHMEKLDGEP